MYQIKNLDFGVKAVINGFVKIEEMEKWSEDMAAALNQTKPGFGVLADLRGFKPTSPEVQEIMVNIQEKFKERGLSRSVVILDNTLATLQLKRTAKESGIYNHERYISTEDNPEWEKQAMDWLLNNIDPDK